MKTYTYKIKTSIKTERDFTRWTGVCRLVYNLAKDTKERAYRHGVNVSNYNLQSQLTECKREFTFISDVHSQTLQAVLDRLDLAFRSFFKKNGKYPKWASKKRFQSLPFKSVKQLQNGDFTLPKFGNVRVFNKSILNYKLKTATIVRKADGLYLHVVVDKNTNINKLDNQVGIDVGVKYLYVSSEGQYVNNPRHFKKYEHKLRIEQRSLSRKVKHSKNWYKQLKRLKLLYLKIYRVRLDFLHKESRKLAVSNSIIFSEDLNVQGMVKNQKLSKHIFDVSWGKFLELISYKSILVKVNAKYTSQTCSSCNHVEKNNRLTQSEFKCLSCGHTENADYNASKNIKKRGQSLMYINVN